MLAYRCPVTHQVVQTSIKTTVAELRRFGTLRLSVWCPHCQAGHAVTADTAFIYE